MPRIRLRSLDVFRGLTVAAMVLVNCPGSDDVYAPLRHAPWHGWTPMDLVFPFFLFIMGVSAAYSGAAREARGDAPGTAVRHALFRAAVLFGLGLLENVFIDRPPAGMRFPGVLQRIALCYMGVEAFLFLRRPKLEAPAAGALLLLYWLLLTQVPVPGRGAGDLTPEGNLAYWLDRRLFGQHLKEIWGDSEGLLSTLGALATSLLGLAAGRRLVAEGAALAARLAAWGLGVAALGAAWSAVLPLNKHLWTSSYALFTAGLAMAALAACLYAVEGRAAAWAGPFEALGRRALLWYVASGFFYGIQEFVDVRMPGGVANVKLWLTATLFEPWLPPQAASLAYGLVYTALIAAGALLVAKRLDRRQERSLAGGPEPEHDARAG